MAVYRHILVILPTVKGVTVKDEKTANCLKITAVWQYRHASLCPPKKPSPTTTLLLIGAFQIFVGFFANFDADRRDEK